MWECFFTAALVMKKMTLRSCYVPATFLLRSLSAHSILHRDTLHSCYVPSGPITFCISMPYVPATFPLPPKHSAW